MEHLSEVAVPARLGIMDDFDQEVWANADWQGGDNQSHVILRAQLYTGQAALCGFEPLLATSWQEPIEPWETLQPQCQICAKGKVR